MPDPSTIFLIIVFSGVGLAAWRRGKREQNVLVLLAGIALMVFPYFVQGLALTAAIGGALTGLVWFLWER